MTAGPSGREAERPGFEGPGDDGVHGRQIVAGGVLERALAHHVGPDRGVGDLGAHIEGPRRALQSVEVLGE